MREYEDDAEADVDSGEKVKPNRVNLILIIVSAIFIVVDLFMFKLFSAWGDEISELSNRINSVLFSSITYIVVGVLITVAILNIVFKWWKEAKAQKELEAYYTQTMFNSNIEEPKEVSLEDLVHKYDGKKGERK